MGYGLYGGYQLNSWIGLDVSLASYGNPSANYSSGKVEADVKGAEFALNVSDPLYESFDVYIRLGGAINILTNRLPSF